MSKNCVIMQRMKENYESRSKTFLVRRMPVIIRIDGKAFHTYTKGLDKPFDYSLINIMNWTSLYLCKNIQGSKMAYTQSDEISILITDYDTLQTDAWFDYNVQKMCSVSASMATASFNCYKLKTDQFAFFDSRAFNIPREEVANYFLARQKDAVKNSIGSVAQSLYSAKELHCKNQNEQQEMIFQKGINWNDYGSDVKRGRTFVKVDGEFQKVETPLSFNDDFFGNMINPVDTY